MGLSIRLHLFLAFVGNNSKIIKTCNEKSRSISTLLLYNIGSSCKSVAITERKNAIESCRAFSTSYCITRQSKRWLISSVSPRQLQDSKRSEHLLILLQIY